MRHVNLESCARFLSACGRGFIFQTATNTQSPNPYRLGFFLPAPPVKTPLASRASRPGRRVFRPNYLKFLSLLSVGTRALATPLRVFSMTYRQQVRQVIWSGGGESEKELARYARIHAGCLRAFPHDPESPRSPNLLQFQ